MQINTKLVQLIDLSFRLIPNNTQYDHRDDILFKERRVKETKLYEIIHKIMYDIVVKDIIVAYLNVLP